MAKRKFKMTPAHEKFCQMYADTGNATASYLHAFSGVTYGSARELGSNLLTNVDIQDRISTFSEENKAKYDFDKDKTIRDLIKAAEEAKEQMQWSAYAKLREMVIKMKGYYAPEEIKHSGDIDINLNIPGINKDNEEKED